MKHRFTCLACELPVDEREPWVRVVGPEFLGACHRLCYDLRIAERAAKIDFDYAMQRLERMRAAKERRARSSLG
jgi:hypothetical protein